MLNDGALECAQKNISGAAVVVQKRKDYLTEAYKQLNGTDENCEKVYLHVPTDPTSDFVIRGKDAV